MTDYLLFDFLILTLFPGMIILTHSALIDSKMSYILEKLGPSISIP